MAQLRNRGVLRISAGQSKILKTADGSKMQIANMMVRNESLTDLLSLTFYSAPDGQNCTAYFTVTSAGTFTITINGMTTSAITFSATTATMQANVNTALRAWELANKFPANSVQAVCTGTTTSTVTLSFAAPILAAANSGVVPVLRGDLSKQPVSATTNTYTGYNPGDSSLYSAIYPDGYTNAIVVNPKATLSLSFGNGASAPVVASASSFSGAGTAGASDPAYTNKLIGAWLKITANTGTLMAGFGEIEFQFNNDTAHQIIV